MTSLFKQGLNRLEILKRIGSIHQIAGAQLFEFRTGRAKGATGIRVRNGLGLDFNILPDNGLDIYDVSFKGTSLAWISNNGVVQNQYFKGVELGWLDSFAGGMMVTCGLRNVGPPSEENGEHFGLHGTYTSLPAENLKIDEYWKENHFYIEISGEIKDSRIFGGKLVNYRKICVSSRSNMITIEDRIVNEGFNPEPIMVLYHFNWGSPLLSQNSELKLKAENTEVRGKNADPNSWNIFLNPQAAFEEIVYLHKLALNKDDIAGYELSNPTLGFGVNVNWNHNSLPYFTQWKMCGEGEYVLGLEPGNCFPTGRVNERKNNRLELLAPSSEKEISIFIEVKEYD